MYTVRIDKTKPVIDSASVQNNTRCLRVSDALSGVANVVVLDSNNTRYTPVYANGTYTFTPSGNRQLPGGCHRLCGQLGYLQYL